MRNTLPSQKEFELEFKMNMIQQMPKYTKKSLESIGWFKRTADFYFRCHYHGGPKRAAAFERYKMHIIGKKNAT